jgi:RNA polymerase sigma factor (sigma-70 family)
MLRRAHQRSERLESASRALALELQMGDAARRGVRDRETDQLRDAMNELSELDREIITLIAWDNLTPGEVATVLGMSANVVRVRTHRARAKLRAALAPKGSTPSVNLP